MSDHSSGPRAMAEPTLDISDFYAFPSPERPGNFVLVMNVFPYATPSARFSDAVEYRFRIRPVRVAANGARPGFAVGEDERLVSVTFSAPWASEGGDGVIQTGTCVGPSGEVVGFQFGDAAGGQVNGLRVIAGCFLDPFFLDQAMPGGCRVSRQIPTLLNGQNSLDGQNTLAIVVEGDIATLFGTGSEPLFAAMAETTTIGSPRIRLERVGRPEIKNFVTLERESDTVNRDLEIRDIYNMEDAFNLRSDYLGALRSRINGSVTFYDELDGKTDWPLDEQGMHPLTEVLLADFLVVDVSKPFSDEGYLEIERALFAGTPSETCGGRSLNHDMADSFLTFLINNCNGPRIDDGVDQATVPASSTFPYLQPANPNPPDLPQLVAPASASLPNN